MRCTRVSPASLAIILMSASASAAVTAPGGLKVPQQSPQTAYNLDLFFSGQGDSTDWQAEAWSTPYAFSPLCGFTAQFMMHSAACNLDFAWYNETGQPPNASDLHVIIPAGSALNVTFSGTDIKNDLNYLGGLVGFALVA